LNLGLLSPQEVVNAVISHGQKHPECLPDIELFVRLVLGEREFARGMYIAKQDTLNKDVFQNVRRLSSAWYQGQLGLPPYDDVVKKLQSKAYAHGIERAVLIGGLMMMSDINRDDIINFFRQMFIDSFDWSILPAVHRLEQLLTEDFGEIPAVNSSSFIIDSSNYERDLWADVWDGLFWRFVDKHQSVLSKQPAMRAVLQKLGSLDPDRRRIISYRAEDFLKEFTN
jgi:deoxyribodipyrimidine photolyase-related protein